MLFGLEVINVIENVWLCGSAVSLGHFLFNCIVCDDNDVYLILRQ